jgi:hypothetical protein
MLTFFPLMSGQFSLMVSHQTSSSPSTGSAALPEVSDDALDSLPAAEEAGEDAVVAAVLVELVAASPLDPHAVASKATTEIPATILILFLAGQMCTRPTSVPR